MKLTLAEIAVAYNRCSKTFLKYVELLSIPHVKLGRDRLFDKDEVDQFLKQLNESSLTKRVDLGPSKVTRSVSPSSVQTVRYEQMLGLR